MFNEKIFCLEDEEYKQNIDPINQAIYQASVYLHKNTGNSLEECEAFVRQHLKDNKKVINPKVTYLERNEVGDRESKETNLFSYITTSIKNKRIIAPTLTTYYNKQEKPSFIASIVEENIANRYVEKKKAFQAKAEGKLELAIIKENEQTNLKLMNNSFSGAFTSPSNPFYNKTAHNSLTTITRMAASLANANNEKLLTGNRHYWSMDVVINNITSIISNTNLIAIQNVIDKYQLHYPTPSEALQVILYSTDLYWKSSHFERNVLSYLERLTPVELAAFVYVGDFYHIRKFNDSFVRTLVSELCEQATLSREDALDMIKSIPSDILNLTHQVCNEIVQGLGTNYTKFKEAGVLDVVLGTSIHIYDNLIKYRDFIQAFFVTENVPSSVAYFPRSIRRSAITSDTDSTIFTVQEWVKWYYNQYVVDSPSLGMAAVLVMFASQTIYHILALLSANLNFDKRDLHRLSMKNEFRFDVFIPTQVAKHYFALIGCREGNVYIGHEEEIKGVHLKNSNLPNSINNKAKELIETILTKVSTNEPISLVDTLNYVLDVENHIYNSLVSGSSEFCRSFRLKTPESYKLVKEKTPYIHHMFWDSIFSEKYGKLEEPPYTCVKIATQLLNKTSLMEFISEIPDKDIQTRFLDFVTTYGKSRLPVIMISKAYINEKGMPQELIPAINPKKTILDICNIFYLILETLGYYKPPLLTLRELL